MVHISTERTAPRNIWTPGDRDGPGVAASVVTEVCPLVDDADYGRV